MGWGGVGGVGWGGVGCYDQLCCPTSPKLLLGLDLGLGCDNNLKSSIRMNSSQYLLFLSHFKPR